MARSEESRTVKTAETVFGIVETLQERRGARISELATELGMANSTVYDHLTTLERSEYVVKDADGVYRLSLKYLDHGMHALSFYDAVASDVKPTLRRLAEEAGTTVWFVVEEHGKLVYLLTATGENPSTTPSRIGSRRPLHATACGKAILAHMTDERVTEILDRHGMESRTERTITDRDQLADELETVREDGYAVNDEELIPGLIAFGVPIVVDDEILGAVGVSGPSHQLGSPRARERVPELALGAVNEIALKRKYSNRSG